MAQNPKHKDESELWRAYTALCGAIVPGTLPGPNFAPAMNILLSCLRDVGAFVGPDYPDQDKGES